MTCRLGSHFRKIADAAQQTVRDARRAAAAASDFGGAFLVHRDAENFRGPLHDSQQIFGRIKFQAMHDAKARPQRRHDQACARGGADQREVLQLIGMNARAGALADNQVNAKILHRGIENFFERGLQAVNFVEKEKIARVERSQHGGHVALFFEQRARS